jgi:toxin YoeB
VKVTFSDDGWDDYLYWQTQDRKILKRISQLIEDISRNENTGIGKPEPLRHEWAGWWSRRITQEHRLVYRVSDNGVEIAVCRFHYGKQNRQRRLSSRPPVSPEGVLTLAL